MEGPASKIIATEDITVNVFQDILETPALHTTSLVRQMYTYVSTVDSVCMERVATLVFVLSSI